jgi:hypothetical protein
MPGSLFSMSVGRDYRFREVLSAAGMNEDLVIAVCDTGTERSDDAEATELAEWWVGQLAQRVSVLNTPVVQLVGDGWPTYLGFSSINTLGDIIRLTELRLLNLMHRGRYGPEFDYDDPDRWRLLIPVFMDIRSAVEVRGFRLSGMRHDESELCAHFGC